MASDNHASYGRIGFTVFLGAIALAIALIYIAGIGDRGNEVFVETYYDHPVSGLSVGSAVNFRGVKIGEVREISFAGSVYGGFNLSTSDYQRVIIVMALDGRRLQIGTSSEMEEVIRNFVSAGIRATIASNAVTGMSRVEFNIPPNPAPAAELAWVPRHVLIPPQPSLMENLSLSLTRTLNTFNRMDLDGAWSNISSIASSSAKLTKEVSDFVTAEKMALASIFRNVGDASQSVSSLAEKLKNNPSLLLRKDDPEPLPETK